MTDNIIKQALTPEMWAGLKSGAGFRIEDFDSDVIIAHGHELDETGRGLTINQKERGAQESEIVSVFHQDVLWAVIAAANAALPDSDPRKITRETIAALNWVMQTSGGAGDYTHSVEDKLRPIRDALSSYLPPEP